MAKQPNLNSASERELEKVGQQFDAYKENIDNLTQDRMNMAPKLELEPQTKLSQQEISKSKDIYLKPFRSISSREPFNEDYRDQYNFDKEYVHFIAENKEIIGEDIDIWTKPYAGLPAEWWKVPTNKPIYAPRYLAEQIKRACYHRLVMKQHVSTGGDQMGEYYGTMAVDTTVPRLDAFPVSTRRSVFMGSNNF